MAEKKTESIQKSPKKLNPVLIIFLVLIFTCGGCTLFTYIMSELSPDPSSVTNTAIPTSVRAEPTSSVTTPTPTKKVYKVGDSLSGKSFAEITDKWFQQTQLSSVKATEYLNSLKGTKIEWVGKVVDIHDRDINGEQYMEITIRELTWPLPDNTLFANVTDNKKYLEFNKGDLVIIKGTIVSFNRNAPYNSTLSPDIAPSAIVTIN
jgi:hypothetical protein